MKISYTQKQNIQSFSSRKLFNVSLMHEKDFSPVKIVRGFVSELRREDISRSELQKEFWPSDNEIGCEIIQEFKNKLANICHAFEYWSKKFFYAVEMSEPNAENRIVTLAEATVRENDVRLNLLQSVDTFDNCEIIRGGGSSILYTIGKLAKKFGKQKIDLDSDGRAVQFYLKNGLCNDYGNHFILPADKFDNFSSRLERKYAITPITE